MLRTMNVLEEKQITQTQNAMFWRRKFSSAEHSIPPRQIGIH
jgi:hypothetical protein